METITALEIAHDLAVFGIEVEIVDAEFAPTTYTGAQVGAAIARLRMLPAKQKSSNQAAKAMRSCTVKVKLQNAGVGAMNVLDLPTEAGHHQCGRGGGGSGKGSKGGARQVKSGFNQLGKAPVTASTKTLNLDQQIAASRSLDRSSFRKQAIRRDDPATIANRPVRVGRNTGRQSIQSGS